MLSDQENKRRDRRKQKMLWKRCPFVTASLLCFLFAEIFCFTSAMAAGRESASAYLVQNLTVPCWADLAALPVEVSALFGEASDPENAQPAAAETDGTSDAGKGKGNTVSGNPQTASGTQKTKADTVQAGTAQADTAQTGAAQAGTAQTGAAQAGTAQTEAAQSQPAQSDIVQPADVTAYTTYTPVVIHSKFYQDSGKIAQTTDYPYQTVGDAYFRDAVFIGDSRMLGIHDYSGWKDQADFFCDSGFSLYVWSKNGEVMDQRSGKKVNLETAMGNRHYGKIYLTVGMNDLGYGTTAQYGAELQQMLTMLRKAQPDAVIYLLANLHMAEAKNDPAGVYNNTNTNDKNTTMASYADGKHIFYLDENTIFTDEKGYLRQELTFDGFHLYAAGYQQWADFIRQHAVS